VQLEGLDELKNPMTSSGIESATFRLVKILRNESKLRTLRNKPLYFLSYNEIALQFVFVKALSRKSDLGLYFSVPVHKIFLHLSSHTAWNKNRC
jgi:hypothetical protein